VLAFRFFFSLDEKLQLYSKIYELCVVCSGRSVITHIQRRISQLLLPPYGGLAYWLSTFFAYEMTFRTRVKVDFSLSKLASSVLALLFRNGYFKAFLQRYDAVALEVFACDLQCFFDLTESGSTVMNGASGL
jgi:hypothetical protein